MYIIYIYIFLYNIDNIYIIYIIYINIYLDLKHILSSANISQPFW